MSSHTSPATTGVASFPPVVEGELLTENTSIQSVIRNIFDAAVDGYGEGILFQVIHCSPDLKKDVPKGTGYAYRFFPNQIQNGFIYSKSKSDYLLDTFLNDYDIEFCEANDVLTLRVRDYTNFATYNYVNGGKADDNTNDVRFVTHKGSIRCLVRVTHKLGDGKNRVAKKTQWIDYGPWVSGATQLDAFSAWKKDFFSRFPGANGPYAKMING
tara:strand:- start:621 stop:1259 length:639 start_codon:yes stop_codon:yes gene_type:complete